MSIDLETLSQRELDSLITKAKKRKTALSKRKPAGTVRRKVAALAKSEGYTIEELFGAGGARARSGTRAAKPRKSATKGRKLGKVPPKYRNPAKPSETWTGRGRQPRWMAAEVAKGKKPDDFLIRK
jgi:DNA-binding protein H-NS